LTKEFHDYLAETFIPTKDCLSASYVLKYWKEKQSKYPILARTATLLLNYCATATPSERLFSSPGYTVWERRTRLSADSVDKIMIVRSLLKDKVKNEE
jgi:hypothetical protein